MKKKFEANAYIADGKLILADKIGMKNFIADNEATEIYITFDASMNRSKKQNAFFHGVIIPATMRILRELGHPRWNSQEHIKHHVLKKPFLTVNVGTHEEYIRSTSDLTVEEMWKFINQCLVFIAEIGGRLNEREQDKFKKIVEKYKLENSIDQSLELDL